MGDEKKATKEERLAALAQSAQRLAAGELDIEIEPTGEGDEIDQALDALGQLATRLRADIFELELKREDALLARERWERSFAQVGECMFIIDADFRILECNRAFAQLVGGSIEQMTGEHCFTLVHGLIEPSDSCVTCAAIRECRGSRAEMFEPFLGRHIEAVADPVLDEDGSLIYAVHIIRDITDRVELIRKEKELAAAEAATGVAERNAEHLKNLVIVAAHELRHPATLFKVYSQLLLEKGGDLDDAEVRHTLAAIDEAATRLGRLASTLLDTSHIEKKAELNHSTVSPRSLVVRAVEGIRHCDVASDIEMVFPVDETEISVDAELITKALAMLLDNAVKFSDGEDVTVGFRQAGGETTFTVEDRGDGIPEADMDRIFEMFYQAEDVMQHSKPGLGLGLYITRKIIDAHDGWIGCESRRGGGSTFRFAVPDTPGR